MATRHFFKIALTCLVGFNQAIEAFLPALGRCRGTDLNMIVGMDTYTATCGRHSGCREGTVGIVALDDDIAGLTCNQRGGTDHMLLPVDAGVFGNLTNNRGTQFYLSTHTLKPHLRASYDDRRARAAIKIAIRVHIADDNLWGGEH